jgi:phenylalanyl-tRNA synthetase beta chain
LVEIEGVVDLGKKYREVIVAQVVECKPLEGSDHLSVAKLDDGGAADGVERDENGYVQVVCGAPNVRAGLMVAWLPPGATVPQTANDVEPFVLGARKLRGVMSNGMIASARELDLYDEHEGILELDSHLTPGASFAEGYELDDYLLDIENKSLTHRPDCFGVIGFAREVAAIQDKAFHTPEWLAQIDPDFGDTAGDIAIPSVTVDPALSQRYQAVVLTGADGRKQSPLHIQTYLARIGIRPINAVVDITNYLMLLTGQPLHAFDYDKLVDVGGGADISVRAAHKDEQLILLDGRTIALSPEDIVIAAGATPIGLAGAMGGVNTEIDDTTQTIIIESATFDLYNLRATQMRHGIFSEAITRFTKGQPPELTSPVLAEAVRMLSEYADAKRASDVADSYPGKREIQTIELATQKINGVLGSENPTDALARALENAEFTIGVVHDENRGDILAVRPPYWRNDVHIDEDVIEEVGRLNGFDMIPLSVPRRDFSAVRPSPFDELRAKIRQVLVRAGANEVLTYSFVHGDVLKKAGQDPANSYRITNSISPDLQYYRQSLTPSLLGLVHGNVKAGFDTFALFELNKTHNKVAELVDGVPPEMHRIGFVYANKTIQPGAPYYQAKRVVEYLGAALGLRLVYRPFTLDSQLSFAKPFDLKRSARIVDEVSNQSIGIVGEYTPAVARAFKLPPYVAGFELLSEGIELALQHKTDSYAPISRFPGTERDICFQVDAAVSYQEIVDSVHHVLVGVPLQTNVYPVDIYQEDNAAVKNVTIRIKYQASDRTLIGDEITHVTDMVIRKVVAQTGGHVV